MKYSAVLAAQGKLVALIVFFTLLSGLADAQGFIHAARIWHSERPAWSEVIKSGLGFTAGSTAYWLALRYMKGLGVIAPEIQTLAWFGVTLVGVAVLSGKAFRWPLLDQGIAVAVLVGIGWLIFRIGG